MVASSHHFFHSFFRDLSLGEKGGTAGCGVIRIDRTGDDMNRGAGGGVLVEFADHAHRQADAAVRGGIAGELAGMQANAIVGQAHEIGHGRVVIFAGAMIDMLLGDFESADRGFVSLPSGGTMAPGDKSFP